MLVSLDTPPLPPELPPLDANALTAAPAATAKIPTFIAAAPAIIAAGPPTGYQSYNGSFDFGGVLNKVTIEIGGRDINLAVGPLFDDVSINVLYNVINTIITQQITTVEEIYYLNLLDTEINFAEEVFEFNDINTNDVGEIEFIPFEQEYEEVTYETVETEMAELELEFDYVEVSYDVTF